MLIHQDIWNSTADMQGVSNMYCDANSRGRVAAQEIRQATRQRIALTPVLGRYSAEVFFACNVVDGYPDNGGECNLVFGERPVTAFGLILFHESLEGA